MTFRQMIPSFRLAFSAILFAHSLTGAAFAQQSDGQGIIDALNQDFDSYIAEISEDDLRDFPRNNAMYLLSQAKELVPFEDLYFENIIAEYTFEGSADDLMFYALVATSASPILAAAYCNKIMDKIDAPAMDERECLSALGNVFLRQMGSKLPFKFFTPEILDVLYRNTHSDDAVTVGKFGEFSTERVLRYLEISDGNLSINSLAALANGSLCSLKASEINELKPLLPICDATGGAWGIDDAKQYRLLQAVLELCNGNSRFQQCRRDLVGFHQNGRCREPIHLAPVQGWYSSVFFRSCMAGYITGE